MNSTDNSEARIVFTFQPRYRVFDLSGTWDFAIDFYLVLGKNEQARDLKVYVPGSLLDLNYALGHGYLNFVDSEDEKKSLDLTHVDLSSVSQQPEYVTIPRRASTGQWYRYCIKLSALIDPQIARQLTANRKYGLKVTDQGLSSSFKWCKWVDAHDSSSNTLPDPRSPPETKGDDVAVSWVKKRTGHADFRAVQNLEQTPNIDISLSATSPVELRQDDDLHFQVDIVNRSEEAVTIRSEGRHSFLTPLDVLYQPEECDHERITASGDGFEPTNFRLVNTKNEHELIKHEEKAHRVPPPSHFTTLEPGVPLVKRGILRSILPRDVYLERGAEYRLSVRRREADWVWGLVVDEAEFNSKAGPHLKRIEKPPATLTSKDGLVFKILED